MQAATALKTDFVPRSAGEWHVAVYVSLAFSSKHFLTIKLFPANAKG